VRTTKYKYVIFDVGGTLVRWGGPQIFSSFLAGFARDLDSRQLASDGALLRRLMIETFALSRHEAVGLGATGDSIVSFWQEVLSQTLARWCRPGYREGMLEPLTYAVTMGKFDILFEDAVSALTTLSAAGYGLGVISNWNENLPNELAYWGIDSFFDFVIVSSLVGVAKPSPEIFRMGLTNAGCEPHEALYVGDHAVDDCEGATGAGLDTALICRASDSPADHVSCSMIFPNLATLVDRLIEEEVVP